MGSTVFASACACHLAVQHGLHCLHSEQPQPTLMVSITQLLLDVNQLCAGARKLKGVTCRHPQWLPVSMHT